MGFYKDDFVYFSASKVRKALSSNLAKPGDLVFTQRGTLGQVALIPNNILKAEKLRVDHWRDKEATRDAVRLVIRDFLWSESTGLPVNHYTEDDVKARAEDVYRHVYRAYPTLPSPFYEKSASV
ncbi:hypothetical protein [Methanofollis tationis]|uniref:Uncharacterized protein n=1 Tax=Methanofollis tationis TaxID=81417 RepID=A0A7K4HP19_9EURY|nr:hypothetical protein [Methanofollis tationis]NVO66797.1 hypothetical protein [Methanofollis tationis]